MADLDHMAASVRNRWPESSEIHRPTVAREIETSQQALLQSYNRPLARNYQESIFKLYKAVISSPCTNQDPAFLAFAFGHELFPNPNMGGRLIKGA
jgi:hypothetical protein